MKLIALALVVFLGACGGGGDAQVPPQIVGDAAVVQPAASCALEPPAAGQQVGRTLVASDAYSFPAALSDRAFAPISYTNSTSAAVTVQVQVSSQRTSTAPSGVGAADLRFFIGILDETAQQLVPSALANSCDNDIKAQAVGTQRSVTEGKRYSVSVPAGHTMTFTPFSRLMPGAGSSFSQPWTLTTSNFDLRLVAL
jgi:hypothetical protein